MFSTERVVKIIFVTYISEKNLLIVFMIVVIIQLMGNVFANNFDIGPDSSDYG